MSTVDQLKIRLLKLQRQIEEEEVLKESGSKRTLILADSPTLEDYMVITCPACGQQTMGVEGNYDIENGRWLYYDATCDNCQTRFRIGEVQERCALCQKPFLSQPEDDPNGLNHHFCEKDMQIYCTTCYMQLFFDGYIDLSSDNPTLEYTNPCILGRPLCTYVGSIAPYYSRLAASGFEKAGIALELKEAQKVCKEVVSEGYRHVVFVIDGQKPNEFEFIIFKRRLKR